MGWPAARRCCRCAALALLALTSGTHSSACVAIVIIGAILGFLRFNTHPARVFMGDGGSQILGFSAAVLAVVLTQDHSTPLSSALPLLLLGIPIIDTLMVMTQRIIEGRSPFRRIAITFITACSRWGSIITKRSSRSICCRACCSSPRGSCAMNRI